MFEAPLYLIAALVGGLIPLILHLMQKRRSQPQPFPTLRFLLAAQKSASRHIRIENLLLWVLRTLIMVLLGMAFAMPVLRTTGGGFFGRAPRDIAIVLDMSYSMQYLTGRETAFERAVETAVELIEGLGENDRYCIILADHTPRALIAEPIADKETGIAQLRSLTPANHTSRILPAVAIARDVLKNAAGQRLQELHILTDNQALAWQTTGGESNAERNPAALSSGKVSIFVTYSGVSTPENITPRSIELQPAILAKGSGARLTVEPGYTGPPRETTVTLFINEHEVARRIVTVGIAQTETLHFAIPPLPPGTHTGRVETPSDNLPADDAFHFLIRVRDVMPTLVCGSESDTFFLRAALQANAGSAQAAFSVVSPGALADVRLADYTTVFLCNALPLPGQMISALEDFAKNGGLLVLFPGAQAAIEDYRTWQYLPGLPKEISNLPRTQSRQTLHWNVPDHPVLRGLDGALTTPVVAVQRTIAWTPAAEDVTSLVMMGTDIPFLLERSVGDGRIMQFSVSADRAWSNFPLTPFYLPMIAKLVEYGAGLGSFPVYVWGEDRLPLNSVLPDAAAGVHLTAPDGQPASVRSILHDGQMQLYLEEATRPGIYLITENNETSPALAVNMPREESNLTPVSPETPAERLGVDTVYTAFDPETLAELLREHRVGRTYGELLLWLVLLLVAIEFVYANRLARGGITASDVFTLEPSGRVKGHFTE